MLIIEDMVLPLSDLRMLGTRFLYNIINPNSRGRYITKTIITFSIFVIALGSLFASDPIFGNQHALAAGGGPGGSGVYTKLLPNKRGVYTYC